MGKRVLVDIDLCYGCFACGVACKQEHNLPVGLNWIRVHRIGPRKLDGKLQMSFYPAYCRHCAKPPCKDVCPEDAILQRLDGVVLISEEKCIGCLKCMEACSFGAIVCDPKTGRVGKCNLCIERIERGEIPACVYHCPTGALKFGDPNEFSAGKQHLAAEIELDMRSRAVKR
jgi:tetrathionate reductase subunit B